MVVQKDVASPATLASTFINAEKILRNLAQYYTVSVQNYHRQKNCPFNLNHFVKNLKCQRDMHQNALQTRQTQT